MKRLLLSLFAILAVSFVTAQVPDYAEVRIDLGTRSVADLASLGIPVEGAAFRGNSVTLVLSGSELASVSRAGFRYEVLTPHLAERIAERNSSMKSLVDRINHDIRAGVFSTGNYPVPEGFELGSMGGFYTPDEAYAEMDSLHNQYPDLVSSRTEVTQNTTIEGRHLYYIKISDNPNISENEPKVLYDALIHAREPMGMQLLFYFMNYLLENYNTNDEVKYLVDNLELYFIPVINADGYYYNHQTYPSGGGMYRKNRRNNGDGTYGVDLNRNFGYMWGYDDIGSSPNTYDETYRGTGPFSEPETQIVRDFCDDKDFRLVMNYHTHGDLFLYPWSYITQYTPDSSVFFDYAKLMTRDNQYVSGTPGGVLYNTNGDANDWMYGDISGHPLLFSFTAEVGTSTDGFWPFPDRIIPLAQENMLTNMLLAHLAYRYTEATDASPAIIGERSGYIHFDIQRHGRDDNGEYTVSIQPIDPSQVIAVGAPVTFTGMDLLEIRSDSVSYTLAPDLPIGTEFKYLLQVSNGFYMHSDTVVKYFGPPLVVFNDPCDDLTQWNSPKWNVTTNTFFSAPGSITDSPSGNYSVNENNSVTTNDPIDLYDSPVAVIEYRAKWNTELGYDYVQVKAANGMTYTPLQGKYTHPGTANEAPGQPVYDGVQREWVPEQIVTKAYVNQDIRLRFTLRSDTWSNADGFYFDDLKVTVIDMSSAGIPGTDKTNITLSGPWPNPADDMVSVRYRLPGSFAGELTVTLCDLRGADVMKKTAETREGVLTFNTRDLSPGLYYLRVEGAGLPPQARKVVVIH